MKQRIGLEEIFAHQLRREFVAPKTGLQVMVASFYGEVLGIEQLGLHDNFFALGGDSLRATQVMSRIQAMFEVNLPIVTIFKKPTVEELAKEITASMDDDDVTEISAILSEINDLSEEDVRRMLEAERGKLE